MKFPHQNYQKTMACCKLVSNAVHGQTRWLTLRLHQ